MNILDGIRLGRFFTALAVKEHVYPGLHVRPLVAELFVTENCNLRCVSCACWRQTTRDELSTDEWKEVLLQLAGLGIYKVNFTGGEPLIRPDILQILRFAKDVGIRHMHLNTNAILLNPGRLAQILSAGVRSFNISVDGPRAVHNKIRGRDWAYDRTIQHLVHLIGLRDQFGLKIRMNFTVMRDNIAVLPEVARLAQKLRVKLYLNLATDRTFLFRDGAVTDQAMVPEPVLIETLARLEEIARRDARWLPRFSDLAYIPKHFSDVVQRHLPCAESQLKLMIHSRGEIGGCWGHDARFNVRETPIAAVIDGLHYREEHARLFRKECVGCGSNYSLNLRWRLPTYVRDLMWRFGWQRL